VLRELRVRQNAQVEDIDLAVRALLARRRLAYDPTIVALEQSPPSLRSWWNQRVRWARGWTQLLKWHQIELIHSPLGIATRGTWTFFLFGRRFIAPVALLSLALMAIFQAFAEIVVTRTEIISFVALLALQLASPWTRILALTRSTLVRTRLRPPWRWFLLYAIIFPIYDFFIDLTVLRGMVALGADRSGWRVTPRSPEEERWRTTGNGPLTSKSTKT
jgi:cellulose synthase/poly-beta-1,6-N-acetylglucosamine synthase-like glycosyltransferase